MSGYRELICSLLFKLPTFKSFFPGIQNHVQCFLMNPFHFTKLLSDCIRGWSCYVYLWYFDQLGLVCVFNTFSVPVSRGKYSRRYCYRHVAAQYHVTNTIVFLVILAIAITALPLPSPLPPQATELPLPWYHCRFHVAITITLAITAVIVINKLPFLVLSLLTKQ